MKSLGGMGKLSAAAGGALLLALGTATARADTVHAAFDNIDPARGFSYSFLGEEATTLAGVFNWTTLPDSQTNLGPFMAFCIELRETVAEDALFSIEALADGPLPGEDIDGDGTLGPMGMARADLLRELWGRNFDNIFTGTLGEVRDKAAAFQIATWEIVFDNGIDLFGGDFFATNGAANSVVIADGWLDALNGDRAFFASDLVALVSDDPDGDGPLHGVQDQVTRIPEPASLAAALLGLVALRRKR